MTAPSSRAAQFILSCECSRHRRLSCLNHANYLEYPDLHSLAYPRTSHDLMCLKNGHDIASNVTCPISNRGCVSHSMCTDSSFRLNALQRSLTMYSGSSRQVALRTRPMLRLIVRVAADSGNLLAYMACHERMTRHGYHQPQ